VQEEEFKEDNLFRKMTNFFETTTSSQPLLPFFFEITTNGQLLLLLFFETITNNRLLQDGDRRLQEDGRLL
jgi:hypothetical protein